MTAQNELFVKMALTSWNDQLNRTSKLFDSLTDAELEQPVAPNRNTGKYLLGHLTAVHDGLFPLLGLGERLYPELEKPYIAESESTQSAGQSVPQLRTSWNKVHQALSAKVSALSAAEWLDRHSAVTPEDFLKEPHRNKLNVLLSRTAHVSYHRGQLIFLQKK